MPFVGNHSGKVLLEDPGLRLATASNACGEAPQTHLQVGNAWNLRVLGEVEVLLSIQDTLCSRQLLLTSQPLESERLLDAQSAQEANCALFEFSHL